MGSGTSMNISYKYVRCKPISTKTDVKTLSTMEEYLNNCPLDHNFLDESKVFKNNKISFCQCIEYFEKLSFNFPQKLLPKEIDVLLKGFYKLNKEKFIEMIRKGPPLLVRWNAWKIILELDLLNLQLAYSNYLDISLNKETEYEIKKDLDRTFPCEDLFNLDPLRNISRTLLHNVLKSISLHYSNVGYCQGMNLLAGFFLLMNGGNDYEAFQLFIKLAIDSRFFIIHLFEENLPFLKFLLYVFDKELEKEMPLLFKFLKNCHFPPEAWLVKWFLSIFLNGFPLNQAVRIWDYFLTKDIFWIISFSIGILKIINPKYNDWEAIDFMNFINSFNDKNDLNIDDCFKEANKSKINRKKISILANEFIVINECFKNNFCLNYFVHFNTKSKKLTKNKKKIIFMKK